MPRSAAARKPPQEKPPSRKARPKARKKAVKPPPPKKKMLTPSEREKTWMAVGLLLFALLAVLIHSGECVHTAAGWKVHFHDLKGNLLVSVNLPF